MKAASVTTAAGYCTHVGARDGRGVAVTRGARMLHRVHVAMFVVAVVAACDWPVPGPGWPTDPGPSDAGTMPDTATDPDAPPDDGGMPGDAPGDGGGPDAPPDGGGGCGPQFPRPPWVATAASWALVAEDLDADGKRDLVSSSGLGVSVWIGHGDGRFDPGNTYSLIGLHLVAGDVNSDGVPDLLVGDPDVRILLGRGDGTFPTEASAIEGFGGRISTGDIDNDGRLDLALTRLVRTQFSIDVSGPMFVSTCAP
jgi:hypothetical protein